MSDNEILEIINEDIGIKSAVLKIINLKKEGWTGWVEVKMTKGKLIDTIKKEKF
ncbi:Uncharacterised protein [Sebaldella termitidis]|uniref:Uncharacterized protein n=1 Tax=Sebaldella termitidis (strain ATCC 33386 / NCTC 11300) TaxID=526218 RepID=D1AN84_SEBTE|nr:hypothetical protein [Sebaldella termitidis]ACZ09688.1 hypothetical protein Sterm_2844 [Sebaldella termitidis ATCC 33386]SUI25020.1 Uncharacterised protein [Sebaldella termitidis]